MSQVRYSIRDVPEILDKQIREAAKRSKLSINQLVIKALQSVFLDSSKISSERNLDWFIGKDNIPKEFEETVNDMRKIDPNIW
jgi:hypothetical protein